MTGSLPGRPLSVGVGPWVFVIVRGQQLEQGLRLLGARRAAGQVDRHPGNGLGSRVLPERLDVPVHELEAATR